MKGLHDSISRFMPIFQLFLPLAQGIDEANVFSRHLRDPYVYKIHMKLEDAHLYDITLQRHLVATRYDQLFVEVINLESSGNGKAKTKGGNGNAVATRDSTRLMSAERFFEEHARLFADIKKRRNLMAKSEAAAERLKDKRSVGADPEEAYRGSVHVSDGNVGKGYREKESIDIDGPRFVKEKAYEKLRKILLHIMNSTKELEYQYKEIRARGWNST
jgi:hypothetical protein